MTSPIPSAPLPANQPPADETRQRTSTHAPSGLASTIRKTDANERRPDHGLASSEAMRQLAEHAASSQSAASSAKKTLAQAVRDLEAASVDPLAAQGGSPSPKSRGARNGPLTQPSIPLSPLDPIACASPSASPARDGATRSNPPEIAPASSPSPLCAPASKDPSTPIRAPSGMVFLNPEVQALVTGSRDLREWTSNSANSSPLEPGPAAPARPRPPTPPDEPVDAVAARAELSRWAANASDKLARAAKELEAGATEVPVAPPAINLEVQTQDDIPGMGHSREPPPSAPAPGHWKGEPPPQQEGEPPTNSRQDYPEDDSFDSPPHATPQSGRMPDRSDPLSRRWRAGSQEPHPIPQQAQPEEKTMTTLNPTNTTSEQNDRDQKDQGAQASGPKKPGPGGQHQGAGEGKRSDEGAHPAQRTPANQPSNKDFTKPTEKKTSGSLDRLTTWLAETMAQKPKDDSSGWEKGSGQPPKQRDAEDDVLPENSRQSPPGRQTPSQPEPTHMASAGSTPGQGSQPAQPSRPSPTPGQRPDPDKGHQQKQPDGGNRQGGGDLSDSQQRGGSGETRGRPDDDAANPMEIDLGHPLAPRPVLTMSKKPTEPRQKKPLVPGRAKVDRTAYGAAGQAPAAPAAPVATARPLTWIVRTKTLDFGLERVIADRREREIEMDMSPLYSHLEEDSGQSLRHHAKPGPREDRPRQTRLARLYGMGRSGQKERQTEIIRDRPFRPEREAMYG